MRHGAVACVVGGATDIDVYDGKIYTGNEYFNLGRGVNISVDIYDANPSDSSPISIL